MNPFIRSFRLVKELSEESLYKNCLLDDIKCGRVFPAIRRERMDFYYKGGKLFSYDNRGFRTHYKYASVINYLANGDYIFEKEFCQGKDRVVAIPKSFEEAYQRIKENCMHYAGVEAFQLSNLLKNFSFAGNSESDVIVLDIEVQFSRDDNDIGSDDVRNRRQERIDALLFNKKSGKLRFIEAKHFSNKETRSTKQHSLSVRKQLNGYNKQIIKHETEIVNGYNQQVKAMNKLLGLSLPEISAVDRWVGLIIYGFDRPQLNYFRDYFLGRSLTSGYGNIYEGIPLYMKGGSGGLNANTIWRNTNIRNK